MLQKTTMTERPQRVEIDVLPEGGQYVRLHDHAEQVTLPQEGDGPAQTMWECDEVVFRLGPDRRSTKEGIEAAFDDWWAYGTEWGPDAVAPTVEERVAALEAAMLDLVSI